MAEVTLEVLIDGEWRDAALLEFARPELGAGGPCDLVYDVDHVIAYIRSTRWAGFERGAIDWPALLRSFGRDEEFLRAGLSALAAKLADLPDLLASLGLPEETMNFPALDLAGTARKLREWGLL